MKLKDISRILNTDYDVYFNFDLVGTFPFDDISMFYDYVVYSIKKDGLDNICVFIERG